MTLNSTDWKKIIPIDRLYKDLKNVFIQVIFVTFYLNIINLKHFALVSGRPYRIEELRLKSSEDIHKLW